MNKIEYMKKERSVLWLREFKEWMDQPTDYAAEGSQCTRFNLNPGRLKYIKQSKDERLLGESSTVISQVSEDDNSSNILESDMSFTDTCTGGHGNVYLDTNGKVNMECSTVNVDNVAESALRTEDASLEQDQVKINSWKPHNVSHLEVKPFPRSSSEDGGGQVEKIISAPLTAIDEIMGSQPSSTYPLSPPHYQEDILQRRLYLEEEFFQLSAESRSLASSDSDTSCSEDDTCSSSASIAKVDHVLFPKSVEQDISDRSIDLSQKNQEGRDERQCLRNNLKFSPEYCYAPDSRLEQCWSSNHDRQYFCYNNSDDAHSNLTGDKLSQYDSGIEKQNCKQKHKRKLISLPGNSMLCDTRTEFQKANVDLEINEDDVRDREGQPSYSENYTHESCEGTSTVLLCSNGTNLSPSKSISFHSNQDQFINDFFHLKLADSGASETCQQVVGCGCIDQLESVFPER